MSNNNPISGIILKKDTKNGVYICYIEEFSNEFKSKIRNLFPNIRHGAVEVARSDNYNYKNTLKRFLKMYSYNKNGTKKASNIKKGIIGELLTHILIPEIIPELDILSIMKKSTKLPQSSSGLSVSSESAGTKLSFSPKQVIAISLFLIIIVIVLHLSNLFNL